MSERKINVRVRISEAEIRKSLFIDINSPRIRSCKNRKMGKKATTLGRSTLTLLHAIDG